ncbi:uncharacterized protein LOC123274063 [Cotesia glomerata]|nr:uncharacterized protein LOC123274063 [Cotesia glomerata]
MAVSNSVITKRGKGKGKGKKRTHEERDESPVPVRSSMFPNKDLLKTVADGTNLKNYATELKKRQVTNIQPYLILMKGQDCESYFIEGDNWFIDVNQNSTPIAAFNILYKLFYVLNLQYPNSLQNFYNFIDCYIFKMKNVKPRSVVSSLHVTLSDILQNNDEKDDSLSD